MAERRMFAKAIIGSARFLQMPATSRLLYYDLGMQADDDGVVEAFTVLRTTSASEDDLRVLAAKGFVSILNDDLVAYINAWTENNQIRKDRYKPSIYAELLVQILDDNHVATIGLPDGNQMETQVSIGKVSIGKVSLEEDGGSPDGPCTAASVDPVITLPLNKKNEEYPIYEEQCQEWAGLYPAVDVIQQLRNMKGWLNANPTRRKTQSGILAFINRWLTREQNQAEKEMRNNVSNPAGDKGSDWNLSGIDL